MYIYYIRDDTTGLYLIGRMKLGAPVPTCVWGDRRADAITFETAAEARRAAVEIGDNAVSAYRYNCKSRSEIRLKGAASDSQNQPSAFFGKTEKLESQGDSNLTGTGGDGR